jgi:hypothetical protein
VIQQAHRPGSATGAGSSSASIPTIPFNIEAGEDDVAWLNLVENDEVQKITDVCVQRWQSTSPEARKKMFAMFAIAGVFLAVCHHGHLLVICDMIRSGEL